MKSEWDKLNDPAEQERQRQEMMQRVHGRAPIGRFIAPLIYWGGVIVAGILLAKYVF